MLSSLIRAEKWDWPWKSYCCVGVYCSCIFYFEQYQGDQRTAECERWINDHDSENTIIQTINQLNQYSDIHFFWAIRNHLVMALRISEFHCHLLRISFGESFRYFVVDLMIIGRKKVLGPPWLCPKNVDFFLRFFFVFFLQKKWKTKKSNVNFR